MHKITIVLALFFMACDSTETLDPKPTTSGYVGGGGSGGAGFDGGLEASVDGSAPDANAADAATTCPPDAAMLCDKLYEKQKVAVCDVHEAPNTTCSLATPGQPTYVWCCQWP